MTTTSLFSFNKALIECDSECDLINDDTPVSSRFDLADRILRYFTEIRQLDPGFLSISDSPCSRHTNLRELTITWEVNDCIGDTGFLVTHDLLEYVRGCAFCDDNRQPFWDLIASYEVLDRVPTRFDHLCAYAHAAYVCQRTDEVFFGALDPCHPFVCLFGVKIRVD